MARARHRGDNGLDAWPGYVDALSTLLMVIIFVLLVFVLAQAFLTATLAGRNDALAKVTAELQQMSAALSLEKGHSAQLQLSVANLNRELTAAARTRENLASQLAAVSQARQDEQQAYAAKLADLERLRAELERTVVADKETITARLAELAALKNQVEALAALKEELEKKAENALAATMTEQERRAAVERELAGEQRLGESARAQIALLNKQVEELRAQFASVQDALGIATRQVHDKEIAITDLAAKLNAALVEKTNALNERNAALAEKVEELRQYRSEFFGKLRTVLAGRPGITVIGDRFVFQSEVLFPVGKAELTPAGIAQMTALAATIQDVAKSIPSDLPWILRVDGHTDPQPLKGGSGVSNWELSAARAISVVKLLISLGVPPNHLAATGFGEFQPFGPGDSEDAYARDRRIELRLTDR